MEYGINVHVGKLTKTNSCVDWNEIKKCAAQLLERKKYHNK